ncbi:Uncharacterised protein [Slackia heliotrinireducens]|uniref:Uncharacterized protein n=1 Tax=Slackia heliotrinireducens (strain ATCC 29202 / DSM 20476 / NCTC 11029 / RHS 1) TaxID=471855 RepID=C7N3K3_SLAHD|nr:hypothetical protein [Slackia heliotrinireducens]ACV23726.1 hypothetical protein Shel_27280 [Slackia heliotrinireducens DSM 20476]VEH03319.1 Uncharacterised protein [Slackia heliotrinireducens]
MTAKAQSTSKRPLLVIAAIVLTVAVFAIEYANDMTNSQAMTEEVATEASNTAEDDSQAAAETESESEEAKAAEARNRAAVRGSGGESTDAEEVGESEEAEEYNVIAIGTLPMDDFEAYKAGEARFDLALCDGSIALWDNKATVKLIRDGESEQHNFIRYENGPQKEGVRQYFERGGESSWVLVVPDEHNGTMRVFDRDDDGESLYVLRVEPAGAAVAGSEQFVGTWQRQEGESLTITPGGTVLFMDLEGNLGSVNDYTIDGEVLTTADGFVTLEIQDEQLVLMRDGYENLYFDRVE